MEGKKQMSEKKEENLNFEDMMKQLEEIASELEKGDLDLDSSIAKFEEGMKLSKKCNDFLDNAEKRITILLKDGNHNIKEENFIQEEE